MRFSYFKKLISKRKRDMLQIFVAAIVMISPFCIMSHMFEKGSDESQTNL